MSERLLRLARRLLPRDVRGESVVGDWAEVHAEWCARRGARVAALCLLADVLRSLPSLLVVAIAERGASRIVLRSLPAVAAGCALFVAPLVLGGGTSGMEGIAARVATLLLAGVLAAGAGWTAAALAGAAPALHGLLAGLGIAALGIWAAAAGMPVGPAWQTALLPVVVLTGAVLGGEGRARAVSARPAPTLVLLLVCLGTACSDPPSGPPVIRTFLSGDADDWEPTLAVAPGNAITVMTGRRVPPADPAAGFGELAIVTWSSADGGETFGPAQVHARGGGDERVVADSTGTLRASWIRVEPDSAGGVDLARGGLVLATSHDRGATWSTTVAATLASGVADKPEVAASPDGRDVYIAFMARGTLDVVASHDGGATWTRHVADSTYGGHWPSGMALGPAGELWIANVRPVSARGDSILRVAVELTVSTDGAATWRTRPLGESSRWTRIDRCVRGASCPVQIALASVAIDEAGRVHVVHAHGDAGEPYALSYLRSEDGGDTWTTPVRFADAPHASGTGRADVFYPMIAAAGDGLVYVAWFDDRDGPIHVRAVRSADAGRSWSEPVRLSPSEGLSGIYGEYGGIGIDDHGRVHVTWSDGIGHVGAPGAHGGTWHARWDNVPSLDEW